MLRSAVRSPSTAAAAAATRSTFLHPHIALLSTTTTSAPPPPSIKFCPECKITAGEGGVCKQCVERKKALTPAKITKMLSEYVVGQDQVKRALGVSMFLHLQRVKANDWIKYDGKGKPRSGGSQQQQQERPARTIMEEEAAAAAAAIQANLANVFVGGFVVQIDGQALLKNKRKNWRELTELQANWDRVSALLASRTNKPDSPSIMNQLAVHAGKAPSEEERLNLLDQCRTALMSLLPAGEAAAETAEEDGSKTKKDEVEALLAALEEERARNDWGATSEASQELLAQRLDVIRALEPVNAELAFRCRVVWVARPVMKCMEALHAFKEHALGGKAGAYLPLDEQKIVVQERDRLLLGGGSSSSSAHRGVLPAKFQLCLDCERVLNLCTSNDEDVALALEVVGQCLNSTLQVVADASSKASSAAAAAAPPTVTITSLTKEEEAELEEDIADVEKLIKDKYAESPQPEPPAAAAATPTPTPTPEESESALYSARVQDLKKLQVGKFEKSNVLLMGPTGSGKTLLAKSLANCVKVPLVICDATSLTAAGYVGDDVDTILYKLLEEANWDVNKAESGIVFLDEVDKIAKRSGSGRTKDISGESVQFGLLKILEGTKVQITRKTKAGGGGGGGGIFGSSQGGGGERSSQVTIDTSNILFVCSGAFTGMDSIVARRTQSRSLGFANAVQKSYDADTAGLAQRDALFAQVEPADLVEFGMIPEFVGRFSTITSTNFLTEDDLVSVLVDPTNSVVNQMRALFRLSFAHHPVELEFTPGALRAIARRAIKLTSGARGLRVIVEQIARPSLFTLADRTGVTRVVVDEQAVESNGRTCLFFNEEEYSEWTANQQPAASAAPTAAAA